MTAPFASYAELSNPQSLRERLLANEVVFCRGFVEKKLCTELTGSLVDDSQIVPLPTDGGEVYGIYTGALDERFLAIAENISFLVARAARLQLIEESPALWEVIKYKDEASLSEHRDREGFARTKIGLTISGNATFLHGNQPQLVESGDLVIMRGREFLDSPTPVHATRNNIDRRVLLVEPNYFLPSFFACDNRF
jgi:hypothetical protein